MITGNQFWTKIELRDIVVFEYDIARDSAPFIAKTHGKIYNKIRWLKIKLRAHNPLVLGSSPSGLANKVRVYSADIKIAKKSYRRNVEKIRRLYPI